MCYTLALALVSLAASDHAHDPQPVDASLPFFVPAMPAIVARAPAPAPVAFVQRAITVRVLARGVPVPDADVQLVDGSGSTQLVAHSDREGVAQLPTLAGPFELWADHDALVSPVARIENASGDIVLALEPGATLRGRVIADAPMPAGASLDLAPVDVDHDTRTVAIEPDGRFTAAGVPHGHWRVEVHVPGYVDTAAHVVDARDEPDELVLPVVRTAGVKGTVTDASGTPVKSARIVLRQQGTIASGAPGRTMDGAIAVAPLHLRWIHPLAGARQMPDRDAARYGAPRPGARGAECGQGHCGIDIGWQRGAVIHAAADGEIYAVYPDIHGEAGRYVVIDHGAGIHTMYMHMDQVRRGLEIGQHVRAGEPLGTLGTSGFAVDNPHLHFALTQERDQRTWYLDPEPVLRHAVVLAVAHPLDAAEAEPHVAVAPRPRPRTAPAPTTQVIVTDADGHFEIDGVAPGTYVAVAFADGLAPGASTPFAATTGNATDGVVVTLRPGTLVRGRVLGRAGAIDGALVTAAAGFGESTNKVAIAFTDHAGEFTLRALTGKITLVASAPSYGDIERTISLDDSMVQRREDFSLVVEDAQLRGQVLAPDGGAAGPVTVRVVDGATHRSTTTDATGRFMLDRMATGSYVIEATSPEYPPVRAHLQTGPWSQLRFEPGGALHVQLRDPRDGAPVANVRIEASGPDRASLTRTTDARGMADLRGLRAGTWTLVARSSGFTPAKQIVAVAAARTAPVTLDLVRGATVVGVVRDRFGRRVAGARVTIGDAVAQTDADGNFRIDSAPSGSAWLEAERDGSRGQLAVDLAPGEERAELVVELAE